MESYDYEMNNADSPFFTYKGNSMSIWAGFLVMPQTTFLLGYNYLARDYDQPSGFKVTSNTVSAGLEHKLAHTWFFEAQYDHQMSDSNVPGTYTTDNIFSVGIRYSY
jgi:predicted porin